MLVDDRDKKRPLLSDADHTGDHDRLNALDDLPGPSSGSPPPPAFTSAPVHGQRVVEFADNNIFVPPGGEGAPPDFAPYVADYFEAEEGSVVSHDPHLNEDGGCSLYEGSICVLCD